MRWPLTQVCVVAALVSLQLAVSGVRADVVASSSLETCVRTSTAEQDITCQKKLVLTVSLGSGQTLQTEQLDFTLACVGSPSGSCPCPCNYAVDDSCTCRDLASPLQVSLTKTPMVASYPMQYLASFNFKPVEVVVRPSSRQCNAGDYESSPTCGWYYVDGQQIPSSQGFTCQCSTSQIFDATLGGSNERTRANLDCDFWSNPLDILTGRTPCSAHCLDFDPLWYSGYQLGAPTMQFAISITVDVPASSISATIANASSSQASSHAPPAPPLTTAMRHLLQANSSGGVAGNSSSSSSDGTAPASLLSSEVLTLSPSVPLALSSSSLVSAKLLGDLATYTQLPAISNMVLLVPRPSGWSPDQILAGDRSQWLLLESSQFSMDGSQCDKVGTSFSAFRYQVDGCARAPQTCLGGQIKDLMAADALRISRGRVPLNLLTRYTYGANSTFRSFNGGPLSFALPVTSQSTSLLLLSVSADAVRLVTNSAPGAITGTLMCTFNSVQCGGFEAGASRGYLWVNLTSLGSLAATFTLVVGNCSHAVRSVEARSVSLAGGASLSLAPPLDIYVEDQAADPQRHCWLYLYNSQNEVVDQRLVQFYTNATVFDAQPSGGYNGTGDGVGTVRTKGNCSELCQNRLDVLCFMANRCWSKFGGFLGIFGGVAAAVAGLLLLAMKTGLAASLLSSLTTSGLLPCCGRQDAGGDEDTDAKAAVTTSSRDAPAKSLVSGPTAHPGGLSPGGGGDSSEHAKGGTRGKATSPAAAPYQPSFSQLSPNHRRPSQEPSSYQQRRHLSPMSWLAAGDVVAFIEARPSMRGTLDPKGQLVDPGYQARHGQASKARLNPLYSDV
ncbi:hypothetical protein V8C86DRAFT_3019426 [Haematococcus lacustris]